jgi:DNA-binding LytR/AlgR family response regulator
MSSLKIGIVEDEIIIADNIYNMLQNIGYVPTEPTNTYNSAIAMIEEEKPDLVLLDIQIIGTKDGIDIAHLLRNKYNIPHIFLTANSDINTVRRAKETKPLAFLVKPFTKEDLYTTIEIAFHNFIESEEASSQNPKNEILYVKDGAYFHKIQVADILFFESSHVNVIIHTTTKTLTTRNTLQKIVEELDAKTFVKVHRSFVININHIHSFNSESIIINDISIPLSKNSREDLAKALNFKL